MQADSIDRSGLRKALECRCCLHYGARIQNNLQSAAGFLGSFFKVRLGGVLTRFSIDVWMREMAEEVCEPGRRCAADCVSRLTRRCPRSEKPDPVHPTKYIQPDIILS